MPGPLSDEEFKRIVQAARPVVLRRLQRIGLSYHDAEECYWSAVMELHDYLTRPLASVIAQYEAWLYVAARNNGRDLVRHGTRAGALPTETLERPGIEARVDTTGPAIDGIARRAPTPEERAVLRDAVDCVDATLRDYAARGDAELRMVDTMLAHVEGVGVDAIRQINGHASSNAASVYITTCYRRLRELLAPCLDGGAARSPADAGRGVS